MKKFFFFVLPALLAVHSSFSQKATNKKTDWGFVLGLNGSNLRSSGDRYSSWKTGLVSGFFVDIKAAENISVQPQFLYSSMGGKNSNDDASSVRLNYFSLPVLVKYKLTKGFAVFAGPQLDVMIQAKSKTSSGFTKVTDAYKEDSYNLTGGVAFQPLRCLGFSLRYIYGLNNVSAVSSANMKNQGIQLTAAVKL
ncbi:porin family protein [Flavisolibacter ginsenosidimutans]|nr:porin family protein [Flavisolibacter ginsenosidimutans]